jgi:hypothetical protein
MSKHAEELLLDALREILAKQRANLREDLREELQAELRKELRQLQPDPQPSLPTQTQTPTVQPNPEPPVEPEVIEPLKPKSSPWHAPITEPITLPTADQLAVPLAELHSEDVVRDIVRDIVPNADAKPIEKKGRRRIDTAIAEKLEGETEVEPITPAEQEALSQFQARAREPFAPTNLPYLITSFIFVMIVGLAVVNVPLPMTKGLPLARAMPDRASLIIRDGIILKASGPEIYMIENNKKRWISSIGAFERHFQWRDVRFVDDDFLSRFEDGRPIHLVVKCDSPHIYRIEEGKKRWIKDIPTFVNEGHYWEEVTFKSCVELRAIPDGIPIPPEAGPPPRP